MILFAMNSDFIKVLKTCLKYKYINVQFELFRINEGIENYEILRKFSIYTLYLFIYKVIKNKFFVS